MNWLDVVLILFLVLTTFMGLRQGIIRLVLPLVGLIVGIILAGQHYDTVGGWLPIANPEYAKWAAYAVILLSTLLVAFILSIILSRFFVKIVPLGWVDHLGGAILGLILGGLLCAAALAACVKFGLGSNLIHGSGTARLLLDWFPVVLGLLPAEFDSVRQFFE